MFVFEILKLIPYPHQSSNFVINPVLSALVLAVLCGINLLMALSNSDVMLSHNWLTGVEMSKLLASSFQTLIYAVLSPSKLAFCSWGFFLRSAYFLMA